MSKVQITLSEEASRIAARAVDSGEYGSEAEVVEASLQLMAERAAKIEKLRALIKEGEESGSAVPFEPEKFLREARERYGKRQPASVES